MKTVTSDFTRALEEMPGAFLACIDPGLKGGCALFAPSLGKLLFFELPTKVGAKDKVVLDLCKLQEIVVRFTADFLGQPVAFLTLEKPFKVAHESVITFGVSMGIIGQLIALFELLPFEAWLYGVTPKQWTSFFDGYFLPSGLSKDKKKKARADALIDAFSFSPKDFFSKRGRLKDGVVDAVAILLWTLLKGQKKDFWLL